MKIEIAEVGEMAATLKRVEDLLTRLVELIEVEDKVITRG